MIFFFFFFIIFYLFFFCFFFFFNDTATTEIYTLSLPTLFRSPADHREEVVRGLRVVRRVARVDDHLVRVGPPLQVPAAVRDRLVHRLRQVAELVRDLVDALLRRVDEARHRPRRVEAERDVDALPLQVARGLGERAG